MPDSDERGGEGKLAFGQELVAALAERRMSQPQLAAAIGTAQSTISNWANGRAVPRPDVVFEVEHELELPGGHLSRHLGYLPTRAGTQPTLVEDAIAADPSLDEEQRRQLIDHYRRLRRNG